MVLRAFKRELAFNYAQLLKQSNLPKSWTLNKVTGKEWRYSFMSRRCHYGHRKVPVLLGTQDLIRQELQIF